ncbi:MAG TPA: hypothetical protein VFO10_02135 [Oligoflexus sp.]|uniref:hypothetical protein n=1 Tax=Oligoflexus sp. TaxID=1971216 RepID=UPI002D7FB24B|nr:hypothetical protein [Oligoflexus sp.]HET9236018.1 hypothetical protein [Oligoflexus sp.]
MEALLKQLIRILDITVHPHHKKRGGMPLLRGRMLSLCCILTLISCGSFLGTALLTRGLDLRLFTVYLIMTLATLVLGLNRLFRRNTWLSAGLLIILSILMGVGIMYQVRSLYASGFLWFQVLIMPAFLLCGWRLGLFVSTSTLAVALITVLLSQGYGQALPYEGDRLVEIRSMLMTVLIVNCLTIGMVTLYFYLLRESEKNNREQRDWLQRTARMQELLQMSGHFALKTNGPLDVLGTALHNLEEPLSRSMDAKGLLTMLAPVESGIQELASVSRSFSLFSRRYLEEGLEQTSLNQVLQHVDTIYNVGAVLRRARLDWERADPDILIYTQTAKLVMLLISILRRFGAEGGTQLRATSALRPDGLHLMLHGTLSQGHVAAASDATLAFDPELNEDLIQELCSELGVERLQEREGRNTVCRLILLQSRCQARVA